MYFYYQCCSTHPKFNFLNSAENGSFQGKFYRKRFKCNKIPNRFHEKFSNIEQKSILWYFEIVETEMLNEFVSLVEKIFLDPCSYRQKHENHGIFRQIIQQKIRYLNFYYQLTNTHPKFKYVNFWSKIHSLRDPRFTEKIKAWTLV